ncbi:velvet factor-domain-containing protein [Phyllosticta citribraziliensis]|uniref:Velvet factor-domain-containing protein n=1 Tax=Phyllosticta citribraziliensis TaxID=989973 RepID=A0ABR1M1G7_9PEZI
MASIIPVPNETMSSSSRVTKEGKRITYSMQVIQQPERARACGSGAKSSADRRPVDPPPIVELRIYEGEGKQNEITFSYNANFFLFATLENARNLAGQGRVAAAQASFPVLTGTPVAGMAYLDRPQPAGYFIFPDLSVRHEGKYRLSFALYEELKEPKDMDSDDRSPEHMQGGVSAHVSHRLEVKSAPFLVFSAKKFPGLTESTALSRVVAEQGCRVRIRRDVRMRRRETKTKDEPYDYDDKTGYERTRTATPDMYGPNAVHTPQPMSDGSDRPRSQSNASNHSYAAPPPRRPSVQEMAQQYNQGYQSQMPPPQAPQNAYPQQMQYPSAPAPPQYANQYPASQPQQQPMQPPQASYNMPSHGSWQSQAQPPAQMPMSQPYGYGSGQQYGHYEHPPQQVRHESLDFGSTAPPEYRRASIAGPPQPPSQIMAPFGTLESNYNRQHQMNPPQAQPVQSPQTPHPASNQNSSTSHVNGYALAPLKTLQPPAEKLEPVSPSYPMPGHGLPLSSVTTPNEPIAPHSYPGNKSYGGHAETSAQPMSASTKRSFSSTFDTDHIEQPLRQGARPNVNMPVDDNGLGALDGSGDDEVFDERAMSYRRADGTQRSRRIPLST